MRTDLAEKAAEEGHRNSPETWAALECIAMLRVVIGAHRGAMQTLVDIDRKMDSVGGLLHPSLYRDMLESSNYKANIRLCKATLAYLDEIDAVTEALNGG